MLYYIAKYLSQIALRVNFKKVFFHYQAELPKDKPIIFAANHPTAFLDPVILGAFLERQTHFIVRGDIFKGKLILAILNGLKMLPIFRFRDGYANLKNNQGTMEMVYQKLSKNRCVLVLAEGETKHEKRLRPIQKGTARMAFGAIEAYGDLDVFIVPVGVNYTDSDAYRSSVMTEIGKPIRLQDYREVHQENPRKAIKQLTDKIEKDMRDLVIHIEQEADDAWINRLLDIERNDFKPPVFPIFSQASALWKKEYTAVEKMNALSDSNKTNLKNALTAYDAQLNRLGIKDMGLAGRSGNLFFGVLILLIGFVPFVVGLVFNFLPMFFAENLAKQKVKKIEFYSSVRYGGGLVGYTLYWLILFIIALVTGNWLVIGFVFLIPFLGYFAQVYLEYFERWNAKRKFNALEGKDKATLVEMRKDLLSRF